MVQVEGTVALGVDSMVTAMCWIRADPLTGWTVMKQWKRVWDGIEEELMISAASPLRS